MTPSFVPQAFDRVMGCTPADLMAWLPGALPAAVLTVDASLACCSATWPDGVLNLCWSVLPDARIALLTIPRLHVGFAYSGLTDARRHQVQRRFDLGTQRGGG
jgi:hypothetical protein